MIVPTPALDLVLINPGSRQQVYQALGQSLAAIEPPIWVGLMANFVRKRGYSVEIIDANAEGLSAEEAAGRVEEMRPLVVAVVVYGHQPSASTQNMPAASAICTAIRRRGGSHKTVLVGGHVSALPDRTLMEEDCDFVIEGEGPHSLIELIEALQAGDDQLSFVRGLWYRLDGATVHNSAAPLVRDLDREMPGVAWDLLPMERYRAHNWHCFGGVGREPYAAMYTTLGCPYKCSFCCIQAPFKSGEHLLGYAPTTNSYRFWSPDLVVAHIQVLVERYGIHNIKIADEMFVLHPRHVVGICDRIIERGYDLNIWAYARVDTVKPAMVDKLRRAGFRWLAFGIEAASDRVRADVDKGFDQDDIFDTIHRVRAAEINVLANYIFGLPQDDLASMQATLDLALELNTEYANFYCTMAYPGSALYRQAVNEGWPLPDAWSGYSQHSVDSLPLPTRHLPASDVLCFRDHAFNRYFASPAYLALIERRFGRQTLRDIHAMNSHALERRFASLQSA
jgi:radical SAM superfamily enzyme YgiQ (UPF0313 family)